jgi:hypothetical protein
MMISIYILIVILNSKFKPKQPKYNSKFKPKTPLDERLVSNLLRGRDKRVDGDLDVDEEGSEQNNQNLAITTPRLRWLPTRAHTSWPCQKG